MTATCRLLNLHVSISTATCEPPDAVKWAPDASGTHWTRAQRGSQRCSITRLGAPAQRGLRNPLTPNAHYRTYSECPVLSVRHPLLKSGHTGRMNREHPASGAVRPVLNPNRAKHWQHTGRLGQRSVPPRTASGECFPRLLQIFHHRNRKYTLNFIESMRAFIEIYSSEDEVVWLVFNKLSMSQR